MRLGILDRPEYSALIRSWLANAGGKRSVSLDGLSPRVLERPPVVLDGLKIEDFVGKATFTLLLDSSHRIFLSRRRLFPVGLPNLSPL